MSELVITAAGFVLQPTARLSNSPAILRWAYNRPFLDSDGVQVFAGTQSSGFAVEVPCAVADGLVTVEQDTLLWTTDNAQDLSPASLWISAWLLTPRRVLIAQLTITAKTQFVVTESLTPSCTWEAFSNYNQAVSLANMPATYFTAAETERIIDQAFDTNPASDTELGTVLLSYPASIPATPVVVCLDDPLFRDADKIEGIAVSDTPPLDGQVLAYNESTNEWEPSNQAAGSGNVVSNEVSSVDGQMFVAAGTGGKTIKLIADAGITDAGVMSGITVDDPADDLDIANKEFVLAAVAAAVQQTPNITALVSGGGVFWLEDYEFQVAAATYLIQGDLFTSTGDTVTLDAADPTLDRIDVIALDENGAVVVITGTAASQPSQPDVDPGTQLLLTFVLVTANTTAPVGVSNTDIYIDNAEWTATTNGSGWNVNSTTNPHSGTKCIEGTSVANAAYVQLQAPAPLTLDTYAILSTFIASKAAWPKKRSLVFQWYTAGVAVGVPVTVNTGFFGFDSASTAYQLLAIPIAQFAVPAATSLNQLRITDQGGAIGMFIDDLVLQANGSSIGQPPTQGLTQAQADARYLQQVNNLSDVASASTARTNLGAQAGPLTGDVTTSGAAATLANTAVTPGSYTNTNLTVDAKGRLTAAANGAAGPGSSIPATVQGDTLFASAVDTLAALAKDTNATRYLSNTGASNNPAWAQVALATGISGLGTSVVTALGVNVGSAGALIVNGGVLGTPSSGTLSACSGLPISTGVSGLGSNVATFLGTPSSANLAAALTDETGSGLAVFGTSPTITTPVITSPQISLTAAHTSDDTYTGAAITGLNAGATIAQWEAVYLGGSSTWLLADANGSGTYPARGLAVAAYVSTNPATILTYGTVRNDAWNWTIGGAIYLSGTAGALTQTAPSTSGDQVQVIGYALTADIAFFDFNSTYLTVT